MTDYIKSMNMSDMLSVENHTAAAMTFMNMYDTQSAMPGHKQMATMQMEIGDYTLQSLWKL